MIVPMMVVGNCLILLGIIRFSDAWDIIREINSLPRFAPALMCVVIQILFAVLWLTLGVP